MKYLFNLNLCYQNCNFQLTLRVIWKKSQLIRFNQIISHDFKTIACQVSYNIFVFDVLTKVLLLETKRKNKPKKILFSPDNENIAYSCYEEIIFINFRTQQEIVINDFESDIIDFAFSTYDNYLASLSGKTLIFWNKCNQLLKQVDLYEDNQSIFIIQKNTLMTVGKQIIRLWEISNNFNLNLKASKYISSHILYIVVCYSSQQVFTMQEIYPNYYFYLMNIDDFDDIIINIHDSNKCYDISNDWKLVAYEKEKKICFIRIGQFQHEFELDNEAQVQAIGYSKDDKILANYGDDNYLKLWNIEKREMIKKFFMIYYIQKIYFNETNDRLVLEGNYVLVFDIQNTLDIEINDIYYINCSYFLKDEFIFKTQIKSNQIMLKNQQIMKKMKKNFYDKNYFLSKEAQFLYSAKKFLLINYRDPQRGIFIFQENQLFKNLQFYASVQAVSFDEKILAIESYQNNLVLINLESGKQISSLNRQLESYPLFLQFISNYILISASHKDVCIYEINDGILAQKQIIRTDNSDFFASPSQEFFCFGFKKKIRFFKLKKIQQKSYLTDYNRSDFDRVATSMAVSTEEKSIFISFKEKVFQFEMDQMNKPEKILELKVNDPNLDYSTKNQLIICSNKDIFQKFQNKYEFVGKSESAIKAIQSSNINTLIIIVDDNEKIQLWEVSQKKQLASFKGHSEPINSISLSPDDKIIASGGEDLLIRLWDVNASQIITSQEGHYSQITSLKFSPDGLILASAGDVTIRLWNVQSKKCIAVLSQFKKFVRSIDFSQDQNYLVACDLKMIILWDIRNLNSLKYYAIDYIQSKNFGLNKIYFNHNDTQIISCYKQPQSKSDESYICVWDKQLILQQEYEILVQTKEKSINVEFIPNSQQIVITGENQLFQIFDFEKQTSINIQEHENNILFVQFTKDGQIMTTFDSSFIVLIWKNIQSQWMIDKKIVLTYSFDQQEKILDFKNEESQQKLTIITNKECSQYDQLQNKEYEKEEFINLNQDGAKISVYQINPNYQNIAIAFYKENFSEISLFKLEDFQKINTFKGSVNQFLSISFSFNDKYLAAVDMEHTIYIWDYQNTQLIFEPIKNDHDIFKILFVQNSEEDLFISINYEYGQKTAFFISKWELKEVEKTNGPLKVLQNQIYPSLKFKSYDLVGTKISPLGQYIARRTSYGIDIKKILNDKYYFSWSEHNQIKDFDFWFSTDEEFLFVFNENKEIVIWNLEKKIIVHNLNCSFLTNISNINSTITNEQILIISKNSMVFFQFKENFEIKSVNQYYLQPNLENISYEVIDNQRILMITQDGLYHFKKQNLELLNRYYFQRECLNLPILSKNGLLFLNYTKFYEKLQIHDFANKQLKEEINFHYQYACEIYLSDDETFFVVTQQLAFRLVEFDQLCEYYKIEAFDTCNSSITSVIISKDNQLIGIKCDDYQIKLWNIVDKKQPYLIALFSDTQQLDEQKFQFSYDSAFFSFNYEKQIQIIDLKKYPLRLINQNYNNKIIDVIPFIDKNGKELQVIVGQSELFYYQNQNQKKKIIMAFTHKPDSYVFSKNYEFFAYSESDQADIILCYFENLNCDTSQNQKLTGHTDYLLSLTFSYDSKLLLSGGREQSVRLWDIQTLQCIAFIGNLSDLITVVEISPDGLHLAAGIYDGNVELFIYNM